MHLVEPVTKTVVALLLTGCPPGPQVLPLKEDSVRPQTHSDSLLHQLLHGMRTDLHALSAAAGPSASAFGASYLPALNGEQHLHPPPHLVTCCDFPATETLRPHC